MIDRVLRSAAEMSNMPFMVLGIRYGNYYEFISTHGLPLIHYSERVPARLLDPKLFAREVEVADLQKQTQFTALSIIPVAKTWRYGGNCPVRIGRPLSDNGVLALSCADTVRRDLGGGTLAVLRHHAEFISDLIWLSHQVTHDAFAMDAGATVSSVLKAAVAHIPMPLCLIDDNRLMLARSEKFMTVVRAMGGERPDLDTRLTGDWLTPATEQAIDHVFVTDQPAQMLPVKGASGGAMHVSAFPFSFPDLGRYALLSLNPVGDPDAGQRRPQFLADRADDGASAAASDSPGDGAGPVSRFLLDTLVPAQRLHQRNKTNYLGVRRWRSSIRKYQIAAMRALKTDIPAAFLATMAREMADAVRAVYGSPGKCVVVAVPCGSSGPGCLAGRLAGALATELGITAVDAFACIQVPAGSSHPRKNAGRPGMKLTRTIDQSVILVDDVATSGSHIDEAAKLLRRSAPSVWPVVWVTP